MAYIKCIDNADNSTSFFGLAKSLISLGQKSGNDIVLSDEGVCPTHANLMRKGNAYRVHVLDRSKEILLNGKKIKSGLMHVGDNLTVGRFQLYLFDGEPPKPKEKKESGVSLEQLIRFSETLISEKEPKRIFKQLLASVVQLTKAEKGFVIFLKDGQRHLAASHNVGNAQLDLSTVSDTIVEKVLSTKEPLIISDAVRNSQFSTAKSVVDLKLSSILCIPLLYRNELLGLIYLGNDAIAGLFTKEDVESLKVWVAHASLLLHTALLLNELKVENKNLIEQLKNAGHGRIIGGCEPMRNVFKLLERLAPTDLSILVLGETGTGKELVAQELHSNSDRSNKPFISINCGAIPENLLESELFGHKKGAFTGAISDKVGKFEAAHRGTIFLDEIGEMPMNLQVKLLRVLQDRMIERVGDIKPRSVDIRIISATNKNLEEEIKEGRFREDLFYRLAEVTIQLPPLRERGTDIHDLAMHYLNLYAEQYRSKVKGYSSTAIQAMLHYYWPGNVRQLASRVKKAVIMSEGTLVTESDMGLSQTELKALKPLDVASEDFKLSYIKEALEINGWNKAKTARALNVDPRTIFRYVDKLSE